MEIKNLKIFENNHKKYNKVERDFIGELKKAYKLSIRTHKEETKLSTKSNTKNKLELLDEKSFINKSKIYFVMLGLLDRKLLHYEQRIETAKKRNTYYNLDNYNIIKNNREEISSKLQIVLESHFKSFDIKLLSTDFLNKKDISEYNVTNNSGVLTNTFKKCINMYKVGYNASMLMDMSAVIAEYEVLSTDIDKQVEENKKILTLDRLNKILKK